jgi:hypothetical protein
MDTPPPQPREDGCKQDEWGHVDPCRRCGASQDAGVRYVCDPDGPTLSIVCRACGAKGPPGWKREPADYWSALENAIERWNLYGVDWKGGEWFGVRHPPD